MNVKEENRHTARLLSADEVADVLGLSPRTLRDKRYRARIGLSGVKVGKFLRFLGKDVEDLIQKSRESIGR